MPALQKTAETAEMRKHLLMCKSSRESDIYKAYFVLILNNVAIRYSIVWQPLKMLVELIDSSPIS